MVMCEFVTVNGQLSGRGPLTRTMSVMELCVGGVIQTEGPERLKPVVYCCRTYTLSTPQAELQRKP